MGILVRLVFQYNFLKISSAILNGINLAAKVIHSQGNMEENISYFIISTVTADGMAPLGARASSGRVMAKFGSYMKGILPKGPYPPCLRMADGAFWQDTLDACMGLVLVKLMYMEVDFMWNYKTKTINITVIYNTLRH